ncbi:MAG: PQQ-binding-like beta-propeller repeat protein [Pirellulales bacterium]
MRIDRRLFTAALGALSLQAAASTSLLAADQWLQFRGNHGDGVSPTADLPLHWSAMENIAWRCELPGSGWSSPVVAGNRIYVTAAIPAGATDASKSEPIDLDLVLLVVDARAGKVLQTVKLFKQTAKTAPKIHSKNSHASPTPLIDGDRIYVHFGHQGTAALKLDGTIVWKNDALGYPPVHGNGGSPVLVSGKLIFSEDGSEKGEVLALDAATGQVAWRTERKAEAGKKFSFCTPLVTTVGNQVQVIVPGSNVVQGLDPITGEEIWRVRYEGYSVIPRPIIAAGLVMVCTGYDAPGMIAIRPDGKGDVTDSHVAWSSKANIPHTPSLVTKDGLLFMVSDKGIAGCLDAKTGEQLWRERIGGNFSASPILAGNRVYILSEEGVCTVFEAGRAFKELAKNSLDERTLASPAIIDKDLLIRTKSQLVRVSETATKR